MYDDGWAGREDIIHDLKENAQGNLMIRIHSPWVSDFDNYYVHLKPEDNKRNPWFTEFWESRFNCSAKLNCTGQKSVQDPKLSFVIKSVYTLAHALHKLNEDLCGPKSVPCEKLYPFNGTLFLEYLSNVSFTYNDSLVEFDKNGNPPARYDILNYQKINGTFMYVQIGEWINNTLTMTGSIQPPEGTRVVKSVCSEPCEPGFVKKIEDNKCCWLCIRCADNHISDGINCTHCNFGYKPNDLRTECEEIIPRYITWSDSQAIISLTVSYTGILLTAATGLIFFIYNDTPVVKSSTRELSYMMLFGMCLAHCVPLFMIAKPAVLTCAISRNLPGISFSIIYAALLTKTNRISRLLSISKKKFPNLHPRFISTKAQIYVSFILIGVELVICAVMLVVQPAKTELHPHKGGMVLRCDPAIAGLVVPLMFNGLLVMLCTYYAFRTRKLPHNFNESKFIGFSMYATCITWIAFSLVFLGSSLKVSIASLCMSTNALVILIFLFFPKLYIIFFNPERNSREYFTTTKGLRCHFGSRINSLTTNHTNDRNHTKIAVTKMSSCRSFNTMMSSLPSSPTVPDVVEENLIPISKLITQSRSCQTSLELLTTTLLAESASDTQDEERQNLDQSSVDYGDDDAGETVAFIK